MRGILRLVGWVGLIVVLAVAAVGGGGGSRSLLVSTAWLGRQGGEVVVLAVGADGFQQGHIPGAQPLAGLGPELVPALRRAGVGRGSHIVLYQESGLPVVVAQAFVALDAIGLGGQTAVLDGGFEAWRAEGRPVETGRARTVAAGDVEGGHAANVLVDRAFVASHRGLPGVRLLDARLPAFYSGAATEDGEPAGHIPGAINLPYPSLAGLDARLRTAAELKAAFAHAGVKAGDVVIVYCHSGRTASLPYFAGRLLGLNIRLYSGSWREWSAHAAR